MTDTKILHIEAVADLTSVPKRSIYTLISKNKFPRPVQLSIRRVGWVESEVLDWICERIAERGAASLTQPAPSHEFPRRVPSGSEPKAFELTDPSRERTK